MAARCIQYFPESSFYLISVLFSINDVLFSITDLIASGSWDRSISLWDSRLPAKDAVFTTSASDKVYCMDGKGTTLVYGLANGTVLVYDIRNMVYIYLFLSFLLLY